MKWIYWITIILSLVIILGSFFSWLSIIYVIEEHKPKSKYIMYSMYTDNNPNACAVNIGDNVSNPCDILIAKPNSII